MADLRIENPKTTEWFAARMAALGFPLPWHVDPDSNELLANDGTVVADVDPEGLEAVFDEPDLRAADLIQIAVNTCGGFKAVLTDT